MKQVLCLNWILILGGTQVMNANLCSQGMKAALLDKFTLYINTTIMSTLTEYLPFVRHTMVTLCALSQLILMKILIDNTPILWKGN